MRGCGGTADLPSQAVWSADTVRGDTGRGIPVSSADRRPCRQTAPPPPLSVSASSAMSCLSELESQLELLIENTRQLGIIVSDFQSQGQPVLNAKM